MSRETRKGRTPRGSAPKKQPAELTARERQVLELIVAGTRNKAIAARLGIAEATVKEHVSNIFVKLGVQGRTEAATAALRRGLVTENPS